MLLKVVVFIVMLLLIIDVDVVLSASSFNPDLTCSDPSSSFSPDYGNNRSFAEAWQYVRNAWASQPECSKGPIKYMLNDSGTAYKFWYCETYGQWCGNIAWGPSPVTRDVANDCGNGNSTRNYTGQSFINSISNYSGIGSDADSTCLPYAQQECEAILVQLQCCSEGSVAWYVDLNDNTIFYVENGVNDCVPFPGVWLEGEEYSTPSPPTPSPTLPPASPIPSPTLPVSTPTPVPTTTPGQGYPSYTPAPPVVYISPSYQATVVPTPSDNGSILNSNIEDIEYNSQVPDVGQEFEEDDTWLDTVFGLFTNHPLVSVIRGSGITTSGEVCSLSVNLYGKVIEITFCDLVSYLELFGYFITVCASIYAYFIIFRVS